MNRKDVINELRRQKKSGKTDAEYNNVFSEEFSEELFSKERSSSKKEGTSTGKSSESIQNYSKDSDMTEDA